MADGRFDRDDDVRDWMRELAAVPVSDRPLPDPRQLWWKAELLKRWDAQRQAVAPIERAEPVQVAIGLAGTLILLAWLWRYAPIPSNTLIFATVLSLTMIVAVAALTLRRS
jgi:hypothetical protein